MRILKNFIISFSLLVIPVFAIVPAAALSLPTPIVASSASDGAACQGIAQLGDSGQGCGNGQSSITTLVKAIVNILSFLIGTVAIIMIMVSGLRYITAGGDSNKVSGAKTGLIYAIIGLVIAALAQFLVHFAVTLFK